LEFFSLSTAKYATSFFVIIFSSITYATTEKYSKSWENPFFYLWIVSAIASSFYAYGWDVSGTLLEEFNLILFIKQIWMDWGLMSLDGENKFLRDEIVYPSTVSEAKVL
jgi:xenotropic and polytropic retrovirus receptor 1